ncbi:MAG TPA: anthrone oxygenase family protein [Propionibacteriaceae bacterium]
MIENLATIMAVLMISAVVIGLVAVVLLFRSRSTVAAWLAAIGLLLMIAVLVITLAVEVPIDNLIASWTEATLPADWQQIRARWSTFTLRTFVALGAVAAAVGAGLTARSAAHEQSPLAGHTPVAPFTTA